MTDRNEAMRLAVLMDAMDYGDTRQAAALLRQLSAERDQLRAEVERLRPNAERWEWIADGNNFDESFALLTDPKLTTYELTRAVDAARTTHKDEG